MTYANNVYLYLACDGRDSGLISPCCSRVSLHRAPYDQHSPSPIHPCHNIPTLPLCLPTSRGRCTRGIKVSQGAGDKVFLAHLQVWFVNANNSLGPGPVCYTPVNYLSLYFCWHAQSLCKSIDIPNCGAVKTPQTALLILEIMADLLTNILWPHSGDLMTFHWCGWPFVTFWPHTEI